MQSYHLYEEESQQVYHPITEVIGSATCQRNKNKDERLPQEIIQSDNKKPVDSPRASDAGNSFENKKKRRLSNFITLLSCFTHASLLSNFADTLRCSSNSQLDSTFSNGKTSELGYIRNQSD